MRTAVDSSALLLILRRQPGWEAWRDALTRAASEGPLLVCPVVLAECSVGFPSAEEAGARFEMLGMAYAAITPESAWLAGQTENSSPPTAQFSPSRPLIRRGSSARARSSAACWRHSPS